MLLTLTSCSEVSKTTIRFKNSLEGVTALSKAGILTVQFITVKSSKLKSTKGRGTWSRVQETQLQSFHLSFSNRVMQTVLTSPSNGVWKYTWNIATKESHPSLGVQFSFGLGHVDMVDHLCDSS